MADPSPPVAKVPPRIFDPDRRRLRLRRAASTLHKADFLHRRAARNAVDSLEAIVRDFKFGVDLSVFKTPFDQALADSDARHRIDMIEGVSIRAADPAQTGFGLEPGSCDLAISLMSLHWANDLPGALAQIRRILVPDGLFLGTLMGAGTLKELRWAMTEAELEIRGGAQPRVSPFADGYDGAGLLQRAGFALPVCDVDRITVRYPDLAGVLRDLRHMGETNGLAGPVRPLSREILIRAAGLYQDRFADPDGRIPATFEMIHLAGWAPHASQQKPLARGSAKARLADVLGVREVSQPERD